RPPSTGAERLVLDPRDPTLRLGHSVYHRRAARPAEHRAASGLAADGGDVERTGRAHRDPSTDDPGHRHHLERLPGSADAVGTTAGLADAGGAAGALRCHHPAARLQRVDPFPRSDHRPMGAPVAPPGAGSVQPGAEPGPAPAARHGGDGARLAAPRRAPGAAGGLATTDIPFALLTESRQYPAPVAGRALRSAWNPCRRR